MCSSNNFISKTNVNYEKFYYTNIFKNVCYDIKNDIFKLIF